MPELIDKKRTEAKVFLIARFFIDRPDREYDIDFSESRYDYGDD